MNVLRAVALLAVLSLVASPAAAYRFSDLPGGVGLPAAKPFLVCPGGVYYKAFEIVSAADYSFFAVYFDALGGVAVDWHMESGQVASSNTGLGFELSVLETTVLPMPEGRQGAPASINWTTKYIGTAGTCGEEVGRIQTGAWYEGLVEGVVQEVTTTVGVECEIIVDTKWSGAFLYLLIAGVGWQRATQSATVVCADETTVSTKPDTVFNTPIRTLLLPGGGGLMVCWDEQLGQVDGSSCTHYPAFPA